MEVTMPTELEIMIHAKGYLDKLANGINPLTNHRGPDLVPQPDPAAAPADPVPTDPADDSGPHGSGSA